VIYGADHHSGEYQIAFNRKLAIGLGDVPDADRARHGLPNQSVKLLGLKNRRALCNEVMPRPKATVTDARALSRFFCP
jgi:hypothetical protein